MNKIWQDEAWEDFEYWTKQDRNGNIEIRSAVLIIGIIYCDLIYN